MSYSFGNRRIIGQHNAREQIERTFQSGRLSHAYLFTGPPGVGKTAFALATAEILNGINNLTDLGESTVSKKSSWLSHPDIHLFMPLPTSVTDSDNKKNEELKSRRELLLQDPYEIVDFKLRPVLDDQASSLNKQAFYPIEYFRNDIRPKAWLKPNEGRYTIIILTGIESMKELVANTFLKLLEEPPNNVIFLLTASGTDVLLPTIVSRCNHIHLNPLTREEIVEGLMTFDHLQRENAELLSRVSNGNYALTRYYDLETLQLTRDDVVTFLRQSYIQDVGGLLKTIGNWQSSLNTENQIALCNTLEIFLRDIMIYRETENSQHLVNIDQKEIIARFCESLAKARIIDMIEQLQNLKGLLYQNIQFKYIFTTLAIRYSYLMRGNTPPPGDKKEWKHLPAQRPN